MTVHEPAVSAHAALDLSLADPSALDPERLALLIEEAAGAAGMNVLSVHVHRFEPAGFTVFALLSQSHIALHFWPEHAYLACDVFSCGGDVAVAAQRLIEGLEPCGIEARVFSRSIPSRSIPARRGARTLFLDRTGPGIRTLLDVAVLERRRSAHQAIEVLEHERFGRLLVLDDAVQFAEREADLYNEALLAPLASARSAGRALIVGGGDGLACTWLLERCAVGEVLVLELDPAVVEVCTRFFPSLSCGLGDPRVTVRHCDAVAAVEQLPPARFDTIVVDLTAPNAPASRAGYAAPFLRALRRALAPGGHVCANGTSIWFDYGASAEQVVAAYRGVFPEVQVTTRWIPSFGSPWCFLAARSG